MNEFKDTSGNIWRIRVNVALVRKVKLSTGIDLTGIILDVDTHQQLAQNGDLFLDVLLIVLSERFAERQMTAEEFLTHMDGDAIQRAWACLEEAVIDFFPQARRETARKALAARRANDQQLLDTVDQAVQQGLDRLRAPLEPPPSVSAGSSSGPAPPS